MAETKRLNRPTQLIGERALLIAIVKQAAADLGSSSRATRQDAAKYFAGEVYRAHLDLLGLPVTWQPQRTPSPKPVHISRAGAPGPQRKATRRP